MKNYAGLGGQVFSIKTQKQRVINAPLFGP